MYKIDFNHPVSIYFVGIGGISMSGLAEILNQAGFKVSGSDAKESAITKMLEDRLPLPLWSVKSCSTAILILLYPSAVF